jgi:ABC-type cobalamin transport system permease subunit
VGTPSHTASAGALTTSVGRSSVGRGVSVNVAAGVFVGAGVAVASAVAVFRSPMAESVAAGASVAGASVAGGSVTTGISVGAAPPQDVKTIARIINNMIRRIILTHFRVHAGQQVDSVIRDLTSPDLMSAVCTFILPFRTVVNARVFPLGDQCGVSTRPSVK